MKISTNWLNDYVDIKNEDLKDVQEKITRAGVNVESISKIEATNLVIGKVLEVKPHPDSDHLNVCMVDLGSDIKQIVCGASNVKENIKVIVAKDGALLPGGIKISKTLVRGVESNGMICALFELGIEEKEANYHKGIHILDENAPIGEDALEYLGLNDPIFNLDLNPNRNDCLSHLGFAYETAAVLDKEITLPDTSFKEIDEKIEDYFKLSVETSNCYLYRARMVKDIVIKESPAFIKERLTSAGMRSINNVVDISNYVMLEYGQPTHFFDYDRLGDRIVVRMAYEDEKITTLDGKERQLETSDVLITDGEKGVCIAGVMGGLNTEIENDTKNILIESAIFNPYNLRYTSLRLDLRSEAVLRYEKGLCYEYTKEALDRACHLLEKYADGKVLKNELVYDGGLNKLKKASVTRRKINDVLGIELTHQEILEAFRRLKFDVEVDGDNYTVSIPGRRMDVAIREDLIEEVGRLYGFDKIPSNSMIAPVKSGSYSEKTKFRKLISKRLRALGLNEIRTYTLISSSEDEMFKYKTDKSLVLQKPLSMDKTTIRQSLLPSMLKTVEYNVSRGNDQVLLYEIANVYNGNFEEEQKLSIGLLGNYLSNDWQSNNVKIDFYLLKGIIENLLNYLGYESRYTFSISDLPKEIHPGMSAIIKIDNEEIGYIGKIHPNTSKLNIYLGEINLSKLFEKKTRKLTFKEINKYPSVNMDLAFIVDKNILAEDIIKVIRKAGGKLLTNIKIFDIYENVFNSDKTSIAFKLTFEDYTKTLTDEEVKKIVDNIVLDVKIKVDGVLRDN